jgi:hypothetical protein
VKGNLEIAAEPLGHGQIEIDDISAPVAALGNDTVIPPGEPRGLFPVIKQILGEIVRDLVFVAKGKEPCSRGMKLVIMTLGKRANMIEKVIV